MPALSIVIKSTFEDAEEAVLKIMDFVQSECQIRSKHCKFIINLALRELLNNGVEHGNGLIAEKMVSCDVYFKNNILTLDIGDEGKGFSVEEIIAQDIIEDIEGIRGRGLILVRKLGFDLKAENSHVIAWADITKLDIKGGSRMRGSFDEGKLILKPITDIVASRAKELVKDTKAYVEAAQEYNEALLDLRDVTVIDSIGITYIIGLYKNVTGMGKSFKITGVNSDIMQLFKIMKLDEIFEIQDIKNIKKKID